MAANELPQATLDPGDCVIFSCRAIPGNERAIARLSDAFSARSIRCFNGNNGRHVSGHGGWPDLRLLLDAAKPKIFVAAHGGDAQLLNHRIRVTNTMARDQESPQADPIEPVIAHHSPEHILPLRNGQSAIINLHGAPKLSQEEAVPPLYAQGQYMTDAGPRIAVSRRRMSQTGVLVLWLDHGNWQIKVRGVSPGFKAGVLKRITMIASSHDATLDGHHDEDALIRKIGKYLRSLKIGRPEIILAQETSTEAEPSENGL